MMIIDLFNATCRLSTQTMAPTLPGSQGIKHCVRYMAIQPHKPIFYTSSYYDGSNVIRLTWSVNQVEYHTTQKHYNVIKMQNMPELSTEDGQFRLLSILYLVFISVGKYRFVQI